MKFKKLSAALSVAIAFAAGSAQAATEIQWWHSMTGRDKDIVNQLAVAFTASPSDYPVIPTFKGT